MGVGAGHSPGAVGFFVGSGDGLQRLSWHGLGIVPPIANMALDEHEAHDTTSPLLSV